MPRLAQLLLLCCIVGCVSIPGRRYAMEGISVKGNDELSDEEIEEHIATRDSPTFLGLFRGVIYDYEVFDRYVLERDLQRIERYYRARGFYWPRVRAGRVYESGPRQVKVEILVEEGPETHVGRVDVFGLEGVPEDIAQRARKEVQSTEGVGDRFEEADFELAAQELESVLTDSGYAYAKVRRSADVDIHRNVASLGYWVEPGPLARLGPIEIDGLGNIPEDQVRRTLNLTPGEPYSHSDLESAQRALLDLGVFSSVSVTPRLVESEGQPRDVVPIDVQLSRSRFRSLRLGMGLQVDSQRSDVHLVAGWEDRNFLGGLRTLAVEFVPGGVIWPTRLPDVETPERLLPQARLRLEFRQPSFLEARTSGVVRAEAGLAPVLLSSQRDRDAPILGYRDLRASVGVERSLLWKLNGTLSQNVQVSDPFTYVGDLDPDLGPAVVSYPELFLRLDARNDRLEPTSGWYASSSLQVAGVGGDARDVKLQPEVRGYVPLGRGLTFSARGTLGLLLADNYGDTVAQNVLTGDGGTSRGQWVRDTQLMYLRGFFGGGPGSNRGYGLREIGPHGVVPFYNPGQTSEDPTCDLEVQGQPVHSLPTASCPWAGFHSGKPAQSCAFPSPVRCAERPSWIWVMSRPTSCACSGIDHTSAPGRGCVTRRPSAPCALMWAFASRGCKRRLLRTNTSPTSCSGCRWPFRSELENRFDLCHHSSRALAARSALAGARPALADAGTGATAGPGAGGAAVASRQSARRRTCQRRAGLHLSRAGVAAPAGLRRSGRRLRWRAGGTRR
jgi:outer membrane translocation and assembly module TamA